MQIDSKTRLYGVIGHPLGHTLSPAMHNRAFEVRGENALYLALETRDLPGAITAMRAFGIRGYSVTLPFKEHVGALLDDVDPLAAQIGAVNTIVNAGGLLKGYNTDAEGALAAVREIMEPSGRSVLILGAGGAARAAGFALKASGAVLTVANRSHAKGEKLARALGAAYIPLEEAAQRHADLLIQTTPVGMYPLTDQCPLEGWTVRIPVVMDMIYNPLETRLLRMARKSGSRIIPGLRMFVHQGAGQFRLWTGRKAPLKEMERAAAAALENS